MPRRKAVGIIIISVIWIGIPEVSASYLTAGAGEAQAQSSSGEENKKARKVYTNEDLVNLRTKQERKQGANPQSRDSKQQKDVSARSAKTGKDLSLSAYRDLDGHDRSYWQSKIKPLRRELESLNSQVQTLQAKQTQVGPAAGIKVTRSGQLQSHGDSRESLDRRLETLTQKRAQVLRSVQDLEEEARKAQALPEWLR